MSKIRTGRLRKLAKHLRGKHLFHKEFDFGEFTEGKMDKEGNYCGSVGCAMGEIPAVWPNEWRWEPYLDGTDIVDIVHKSQQDIDADTDYDVIAEFFSITYEQVYHLFEPNEQDTDNFGGEDLNRSATAEQVAANIDAFVKEMA